MSSNDKEIRHKIPKLMIMFLAATTIILILFRIFIIYFELPELIEKSRDYDYRNLLSFLEGGLVGFPPYYLYFWYFIFFPFGLLDPFTSMLVWDILRLITTSYVIYHASNMITYRKDLYAFYLVMYTGFAIDGWYNNCNFVMMIFIFISYKFLEEQKKWTSGIFFALSTAKINSIIFLPVLLISKKIKLKELVYYLIPFGILIIPYLIFPEYTIQLYLNWTSTPTFDGTPLEINLINSILLRIIQPAQFLYYGIFLMIVIEFIIKLKRYKLIRKVFYILILIFCVYYLIFVWILPLYSL